MHNHHDTKKTLPPWRANGGGGGSACCCGTWAHLILDFLEQENLGSLYQNWGGSDTSTGGTGTAPRYGGVPNRANVAQKRVGTLTCPSDTPNSPINSIPNHNYVVNVGTSRNSQNAVNGIAFQPGPFGPAKFVYTDATQTTTTPGGWIVRPQKGVGTNEILDGLSNTVMVAELIQGTGSDLRGFFWWGSGAAFTSQLPPNSPLPDSTEQNCNNLPALNLPCVNGGASVYLAARSRHPGGVQVVMCDGSARFIRQSISINVWRAASTIKGSEAQSLDQ
jgi:prepilin-type processing-associated H-X9-DG protein